MDRERNAYGYAAFVIAFWATVASAFKITLRYLDPIQLVLYSTIISVIVLFIILIIQGKFHLLLKSNRKSILYSAVLGFFSPFLYYIILFKAYSLLPAQEAQPLNQTWIIILPVFSIFLLGQKIKATSIIALLIGFFGALIISTHGDILALKFSSLTGVLLAILSAIIWSIFWIYNMKDKRDEVVKLFLNFVFGLVFILITVVLLSDYIIKDINGFIGAAYIGIFEMGVTFVLWLYALKYAKTTAHMTTLIYCVPFISLIIIHFTVGETILLSTVVGLLIIIIAIIIQQWEEITGGKR